MVRRRAGAPVPALDPVAAVGPWMEVWRAPSPPPPPPVLSGHVSSFPSH
jgi:hypothetical protein